MQSDTYVTYLKNDSVLFRSDQDNCFIILKISELRNRGPSTKTNNKRTLHHSMTIA